MFQASHVPMQVAVWQKLSPSGSGSELGKPSCSHFWAQGREDISFYCLKWPLVTPFLIFFLKKQCDDTGISSLFSPWQAVVVLCDFSSMGSKYLPNHSAQKPQPAHPPLFPRCTADRIPCRKLQSAAFPHSLLTCVDVEKHITAVISENPVTLLSQLLSKTT